MENRTVNTAQVTLTDLNNETVERTEFAFSARLDVFLDWLEYRAGQMGVVLEVVACGRTYTLKGGCASALS